MKGKQELTVTNLVALGATRTLLEQALRLIHQAMAVTPVGMDAVTELARAGGIIATQEGEHARIVEQIRAGARAMDLGHPQPCPGGQWCRCPQSTPCPVPADG